MHVGVRHQSPLTYLTAPKRMSPAEPTRMPLCFTAQGRAKDPEPIEALEKLKKVTTSLHAILCGGGREEREEGDVDMNKSEGEREEGAPVS